MLCAVLLCVYCYRFMGYVNMLGVAYESPTVATGYGMYIAQVLQIYFVVLNCYRVAKNTYVYSKRQCNCNGNVTFSIALLSLLSNTISIYKRWAYMYEEDISKHTRLMKIGLIFFLSC